MKLQWVSHDCQTTCTKIDPPLLPTQCEVCFPGTTSATCFVLCSQSTWIRCARDTASLSVALTRFSSCSIRAWWATLASTVHPCSTTPSCVLDASNQLSNQRLVTSYTPHYNPAIQPTSVQSVLKLLLFSYLLASRYMQSETITAQSGAAETLVSRQHQYNNTLNLEVLADLHFNLISVASWGSFTAVASPPDSAAVFGPCT
eukprot:3609843-Amphidinium_carterae.1